MVNPRAYLAEAIATFGLVFFGPLSVILAVSAFGEELTTQSVLFISLGHGGAIALMVDTGFIGIFLYLLNLLLGFIAILKSQNKNKYVISIVYLSVVLFSFVGTLTSVLLFYFWVMHKNPVILMLEKNENKT